MHKNKTYRHTLFYYSIYFLSTSIAGAANSELQPSEPVFANGDRIVILGGTLAERMQHDAWLETLIQSRAAGKNLSFRNLGFSADSLNHQLRVAGFGSQDKWLEKTKPDWIFSFSGFNESFKGESGIDQFKKDLRKFVNKHKATKYNGEKSPQIILFSPIAHEDLKQANLPDGTQNNRRLQLYTNAISEIAEETNVYFVDLFTPTLQGYREDSLPWTINGIHLTERGNRKLGEIIAKEVMPIGDSGNQNIDLDALRSIIQDKNFHWFHRYQPTDGYNVHGHRADLKYIDDLSNREVMQRELDILDQMTSNRDSAIWAFSQGKEPIIDDSNLPSQYVIKTNAPGKGAGGKHLFLGGEDAIKKMTLADGTAINLFASEEQFPDLINPVQIGFDAKNRLFVATWPGYPHWKPGDAMDDKLLILEDTDGDGNADSCKTFADGLHNPTGFEFWGGGVFVATAPDLLFLKDTDGDDVADVRIRVLHGLSSGDTHHAANSFVFGPDGNIYFGEGIFHRSQIETPYGAVRNRDGCIWKFDPRTWKVERFIPYNFANPHGHVFDSWGQNFVYDGTSAYPYHAAIISGHIDYPNKRRNQPPSPLLYDRKTRPCPGVEIISSKHFPDEYQDRLLVGNVIGFQGILRYRLDDKDSSFAGFEEPYLVRSSDPNFRPTDIEVGPEGAIYFSDWQNPIIGHMQHHIRDPSRDNQHGRVYRISYPSRPYVQKAQIEGQPIESLLALLKSPENRVRYRTRIELSGRDSAEVLLALEKWIGDLDPSDSQYHHQLLEGLWVYQQHHQPNPQLLTQVLESPDFRARAAAVRVLPVWKKELTDPLTMLEAAIADSHPRVRLEAVRACSFFQDPRALEIALRVLDQPMDRYLQYTLTETVRQLQQKDP
ncbi:MAG: GDSL-type esterase/lipase family protein [Planctomycetales bacterium]